MLLRRIVVARFLWHIDGRGGVGRVVSVCRHDSGVMSRCYNEDVDVWRRECYRCGGSSCVIVFASTPSPVTQTISIGRMSEI